MPKPSFLSRFGHLLGNSVAAAKPKAEEEYKDPEKAEDESEEEHAQRCKAAKAEWDKEHASAESPTEEEEDEDEDEGEKERKTRKTRKAKASRRAEDDEDEAEMRGATPVAEARERERERCARIMAHPAAAVRPDMAAHLMSEPVPYWRAAGLLEAAAAGHNPAAAEVEPRRPSLRDRMETAPASARNPINRDEPGQETGPQAAAQFALKSAEKARGTSAAA